VLQQWVREREVLVRGEIRPTLYVYGVVAAVFISRRVDVLHVLTHQSASVNTTGVSRLFGERLLEQDE